MGVRRSWRPGRRRVCLGRRDDPGWTVDGEHLAGRFPNQNTKDDGYEGTAPVGRYPPNGYGLMDMIGNVWEWTSDWYESDEASHSCCTDPADQAGIPRRVMKGGSHLCAPSYCRRYRPAARMAQAVDTSTCHLGFRLIVRRPS